MYETCKCSNCALIIIDCLLEDSFRDNLTLKTSFPQEHDWFCAKSAFGFSQFDIILISFQFEMLSRKMCRISQSECEIKVKHFVTTKRNSE